MHGFIHLLVSYRAPSIWKEFLDHAKSDNYANEGEEYERVLGLDWLVARVDKRLNSPEDIA